MHKRVVLIGAEFEENLSLRYLAASVVRDGFEAEILAFNDWDQTAAIAQRVLELRPLVVGLSMPFQQRAPEFLALAQRLRASGVDAHITIGGHFATFEFGNIMRDFPAIDSAVRHEGEQTLRELCARVRDGLPLEGLAGAVVRTTSGLRDGGKRQLPPLDSLPFPDRRGIPHQAMGVAASPIVGSRGCYADCSFCCIYAYAENADGARYRRRTPESIVAEMKNEYDDRGVRLFVFHDDNFFVPREEQNIARYTRMKELLDEAGLSGIGLVIKCRPNDVTPRLFSLLRSIGLVRAYVGIETNSDEGIVSLNRRITSEDNRRALSILRDLDVYHTFNVLIFDPEASRDGVEANLRFMEAFVDVPFNFCRAEVYAGTPLKQILEEQNRLSGSYFAWNYSMRDPRVELLFRVAVTAFASRNFKPDGVANLNMGIRGDNEVLRRFYGAGWDPEWHYRVRDYSRRVGADTIAHMREAVEFVKCDDAMDASRARDFSIGLARRVARADLAFVAECRELRRELEDRVRRVVAREIDLTVGRQRAPWAAETLRLTSSVGREISTELLPFPAALKREAVV